MCVWVQLDVNICLCGVVFGVVVDLFGVGQLVYYCDVWFVGGVVGFL